MCIWSYLLCVVFRIKLVSVKLNGTMWVWLINSLQFCILSCKPVFNVGYTGGNNYRFRNDGELSSLLTRLSHHVWVFAFANKNRSRPLSMNHPQTLSCLMISTELGLISLDPVAAHTVSVCMSGSQLDIWSQIQGVALGLCVVPAAHGWNIHISNAAAIRPLL